MGAFGRATAWSIVLVVAGLAGCIGAQDTADPTPAATSTDDPEALGVHGIDEANLTEATHDILPKVVRYVEANVSDDNAGDDVELYTEIYLPDGEGPWPTILESSPYNLHTGDRAVDDTVLASKSLVERYVPRGYAVVIADVRGTGNSEGCMNMMGAKEQADQARLVDWIADQVFSDGNVAMHGVSYVGTTPHEAAIENPDDLATVVTIAGVTNQWRNVFMNGVPYDGRHYPITYEVGQGAPPPLDVLRGPDWATNAASGACGQQAAIEHMSPGTYEKGVYDDYWNDRNLTRGAANVTAPILYSQGFDDRAVNPSEAIHWFNDLDVEKKGLFHQQGHQYPPRDDYFTIEHAWFDHYLKGRDTGVTDTPTVEVLTNDDTIRTGDTWPPTNASTLSFNLTDDELVHEPVDEGSQTYLADMARNAVDVVDPAGPAGEAYQDPAEPAGLPSTLTWTSEPFEKAVHLAGPAELHLEASVDAENTYFVFDLYDVAPDGDERWLGEGWFNAHLREGFDQSAPLTPGERYRFDFGFEPREWVIQPDHKLELRVTGHDSRVFPIDQPATQNTIHYGPDGAWLELPVLENPSEHERPDEI
jgi:putative CocE/NonD family hydrolase